MIAISRQVDGAAPLMRVLVAGALGVLAFADRAFAAPHDTTLVSRVSAVIGAGAAAASRASLRAAGSQDAAMRLSAARPASRVIERA